MDGDWPMQRPGNGDKTRASFTKRAPRGGWVPSRPPWGRRPIRDDDSGMAGRISQEYDELTEETRGRGTPIVLAGP